MEVWNDLRMLVARYLVASEQMERDGPVAQAVRSVGYQSEEEDEEEEEDDEEEGSSVEAEDAAHEHDHHEHEHEEHEEAEGDTDEVPAYNASAAPPLEVGPNGYAIDKKDKGDFQSDVGSNSRREGKAPARDNEDSSPALGKPTFAPNEDAGHHHGTGASQFSHATRASHSTKNKQGGDENEEVRESLGEVPHAPKPQSHSDEAGLAPDSGETEEQEKGTSVLSKVTGGRM